MLDFGYYNMDCMDGMKLFPDKHFDIAVVDPPYFSGPEKRKYYGRAVSPIGVQRHYKPSDEWNVPDKAYFEELARVSKNQIIWGCNYFDYSFGSGRIVWDKCNGEIKICIAIPSCEYIIIKRTSKPIYLFDGF